MWHGKWREILELIPRETLLQNPTLFFQGPSQADSKGVVSFLLLKHLFTFSLLLLKCFFTFCRKMEEYTFAKDIYSEGTPKQGICGEEISPYIIKSSLLVLYSDLGMGKGK
jgi:hypothetical protein